VGYLHTLVRSITVKGAKGKGKKKQKSLAFEWAFSALFDYTL
jgi:hypothetical protein